MTINDFDSDCLKDHNDPEVGIKLLFGGEIPVMPTSKHNNKLIALNSNLKIVEVIKPYHNRPKDRLVLPSFCYTEDWKTIIEAFKLLPLEDFGFINWNQEVRMIKTLVFFYAFDAMAIGGYLKEWDLLNRRYSDV
jgi:hypothetical protein